MRQLQIQLRRTIAATCCVVLTCCATPRCFAEPPSALGQHNLTRHRTIDDLNLNIATEVGLPPRERVKALLTALKYVTERPLRPILDPIDGEIMDHDRVLDMIIHAMLGLSGEKNAAALLKDDLKNEPNQEAREVIQIALGLDGDPSGWRDVVSVLRQKGRTKIREWAVGALGQSKATLAIPDLLDALQDPDILMRPVGGAIDAPIVKPHYAIRGVAAAVLSGFGVKVEYLDHQSKDFRIDKASAANALKPELHNKDKEHVKQAIEAIARVGGPAAKVELKRFIQEQERVPGKDELVAKAKEALSRIETDKK